MGLWHRKQSTAPATANPAKVGGPDWNDEHVVDPGSFTDEEIAEANKDGAADVPSMRTLGTGALQAAAGNHSHTGVYATTGHGHAQADVDGLAAALAAKAPSNSPALTGTPTAPTAAPGTNTEQVATTAYALAAAQAAAAALAGAAPAVLDTLVEIATALGNDANFAATITAALAAKQPLNANLTTLAGVAPTATGTALLGAASAAAARGTLGLGTAALVDTGTGAANVPTITQADARYALAGTTMTIGLATALSAGVVTC